MCRHILRSTGVLLTIILLGSRPGLQAQAATVPLQTWRAEPALTGDIIGRQWVWGVAPAVGPAESPRKHSHTWTGLLVGGLVGGAATAVFLTAFCDGADTACGADEVGRAVVIIAVPVAAAGALIGSLIRTE